MQQLTSSLSPECCSTVTELATESHAGGLATIVTIPSPTVDVSTSRGVQGIVIAGAAIGTSAGVLVIGIAVVIICIVTVTIFHHQRRYDKNDTEMKVEDGLSNSVYNTSALGQAAKISNGFANPGYSSTSIRSNSLDNQHDSHNSPEPNRDMPLYAVLEGPTEDGMPQYAVLEGPTTITPTAKQPQQYEELDDTFHSPYFTPVDAVATQPPPISAENVHTYECVTSIKNSQHSEEESGQHFHSAHQTPIIADSSTAEHVYSHLDHNPSRKRLPSTPFYSHLLHDSQPGEGEREEEDPSDPSYSNLFRQQNESEQKADMMATIHNTHSHRMCGKGGHDLSQNGALLSMSSHSSDSHA